MTEQVTRPLRAGLAGHRPADLEPSDSVGDWTVVRILANGGFSTVYEAMHRATGRRAALKLLHAHLVKSPDVVARFIREVDVIGRLRHANIVHLIDAGLRDDGRPYLCMELLDGENLQTMVGRGSLPADLALEILAPICEALAAAHELGIIHRDVKASNVMICRPPPGRALGRIVLLDFGIAKLSDALAPELTASNQVLGTPATMSPEQIAGTTADARTDVYALGVLLFHMLAGRMPFDDASATMTGYLHLHARRPRVSAVAAVSGELEHVIVRAMAIDPAERFSGPIALLAEARAAVREPVARVAVEPGLAAVVIVSATDREPSRALDDGFLTELEAVLPAAERYLGNLGFAPALDVGASCVFVAPLRGDTEPVAVALQLWAHLRERSRDPRVQIGICVDHAPSERVALRRAVPAQLDGVWVGGDAGPAKRIC